MITPDIGGRIVITIRDLTNESRRLMAMPNDVVDGKYDYRWPEAGNTLRIELEAKEDRKIRFFIDVSESKRSSTLILAPLDRKSKMQTRAGNQAIVRIDFSDNPEILVHRNPDGTKIVGSHIHFDVAGYGIRYAWPLEQQDIVVPSLGFNSEQGHFAINAYFEAMLKACNVTDHLIVNYSLGV